MNMNEKDLQQKVGIKIYCKRIELNLSLIALSEFTAIELNRLDEIEKGSLPISVEELLTIAAALKISAADLMPK